MSLGICAKAVLVLQDESAAVYRYGCYNLNTEGHGKEAFAYDGEIVIQKSCFVSPDIHTKLKKLHGGRKKPVTKRIVKDVDCEKYLKEGRITVSNCSNCFGISADTKTDVTAFHVLHLIFEKYQENDVVPEYVIYYV